MIKLLLMAPQLLVRNLLICIFLSAASLASTEVSIMVSGPWAYVQDPSSPSRVLVIAPNSAHHLPAVVFAGSDARLFKGKTPLKTGQYNLDFQAGSCSGHQHSGNDKSPEVFNVDLQPNQIQAATNSTNMRYSFSLPKPCFYSTYKDYVSKMDLKEITQSTPEKPYTIWMVLHYWVDDASSASKLSGASDDGTQANADVPFSPSPGFDVPGISVVLPGPQHDSDIHCDSISLESVKDLAKIFGLTLFARFRDQYTGVYDYDNCSDLKLLMKQQDLARKIIPEIYAINEASLRGSNDKFHAQLSTITEQLKSFYADRLPEDVKGDLAAAQRRAPLKLSSSSREHAPRLFLNALYDMEMVTPGSADCHGPMIASPELINF